MLARKLFVEGKGLPCALQGLLAALLVSTHQTPAETLPPLVTTKTPPDIVP